MNGLAHAKNILWLTQMNYYLTQRRKEALRRISLNKTLRNFAALREIKTISKW